MGIYYCAIDVNSKEKIEAPIDFGIKSPSIFHPENPFPGMVIMMNVHGSHFEIFNDGGMQDDIYYMGDLKDITEEVYKKYLSYFPFLKEENDETL